MRYAQGKRAFGFCDRCHFRYPLNELRFQVVAQKMTKLRVCSGCLDVDHPQLMLGRVPINDPIALRDPRPDRRESTGVMILNVGALNINTLG